MPAENAISTDRLRWQRISAAAVRGEGLQPYPESGYSNLFDWAERSDALSTHVMASEGDFLVDIVEIEDNAVHQPSKPDDEIVCILNGVLTLTTDGDGAEQVYRKGQYVLIPAGWAGIYRVGSDDGCFRELCVVPADYFDPAAANAPSGDVPRAILPLAEPGSKVLLDARYTIEIEHRAEPRDERFSLSGGEGIVHVLAGTLRLEEDEDAETFEAGSFVVVGRNFSGRAVTSAGYHGLVARWKA